ncbi:MAG: YraN family protein [Gammaproteobacteria bacterium]|nr:YraN family protein [Gammaproteobacteria bacterium]
MASWWRCPSSFPRPDAQRQGRRAERGALWLLRWHGLRLVYRNYRTRGGEIDLVMRDGDDLVFVEVRYRARADFGTGADSVDIGKRARIIDTAHHFLAQHADESCRRCRFDVVSVTKRNYRRQYHWIQDAFQL